MRNRAYTLIELLVVLAIIGALTALIFGALGSSRERARRSVCASNMHQWGLAFAMYSEDYGGRVPAVGDHLTTAQMGLPPFAYVFNFEKLYKIDGTAAMNCPDTHYMPGQTPLGSSYLMAGFDIDDPVLEAAIPNMTALLGPRYPLLICEMHNAETDWEKQPSWAKKNVQVLRINQQVTFESVPVHTSGFQE